MIGAANDVRDAHVDVVDDYAQLVGGHPARTQQHEILNVCVLHFARSEDRVFKRSHAGSRRLETDGPWQAFFFFGSELVRTHVAARAGRQLRGFRPFRVTLVFHFVFRRGIVSARVRSGFAVARVARATRENLLRRRAIRNHVLPHVDHLGHRHQIEQSQQERDKQREDRETYGATRRYLEEGLPSGSPSDKP